MNLTSWNIQVQHDPAFLLVIIKSYRSLVNKNQNWSSCFRVTMQKNTTNLRLLYNKTLDIQKKDYGQWICVYIFSRALLLIIHCRDTFLLTHVRHVSWKLSWCPGKVSIIPWLLLTTAYMQATLNVYSCKYVDQKGQKINGTDTCVVARNNLAA